MPWTRIYYRHHSAGKKRHKPFNKKIVRKKSTNFQSYRGQSSFVSSSRLRSHNMETISHSFLQCCWQLLYLSPLPVFPGGSAVGQVQHGPRLSPLPKQARPEIEHFWIFIFLVPSSLHPIFLSRHGN